MAVIFKADRDGIHYEVRQAGRSLRLYTNGAFHSQLNPGYLFTGAVWDLLALPSLCSPDPTRRVLALGVGGGTVIHQLDRLHDLEAVTGVELDAMHIRIAREYFNLNFAHTRLVQADAREWVTQQRSRFDYIVDDVFLHGEVDPDRPFYPDDLWCKKLIGRLRPGGVVVQNHIDDRHARAGSRVFREHFDRVLTLRNDKFGNTVVAGFLTGASSASLKRNCERALGQLPRRETSRLRVTISG